MGVLMTGRSSLIAVAAVLVLGATLVIATERALAIPEDRVLGAVPAANGLDYASSPGIVDPLNERFVARVLGLPLVTSGSTDPVEPVVASARPTLAASTDDATSASTPATAGSSSELVRVTHAPTNDDVADALVVDAVPFRADTSASTASRQSDEPDDCAPVGPTLWYRHRPTTTRGLLVHATTGGPVAVSVFAGDAIRDLRSIGCHAVVTGVAGVRFTADADTTYLYRVTSPLASPTVGFGVDLLGATARLHAPDGSQVVAAPQHPVPSADGRFVVFESFDGNLVDDDTNGTLDVFVHDRETGQVELVSRGTDGRPGNGASGAIENAVSQDGRWVAFASRATDLVEGDTNDQWDYFVRDRVRGETRRVSVHRDGSQGTRPPPGTLSEEERRATCETNDGEQPDAPGGTRGCRLIRLLDMTPDGRFVVFWSSLSGLVDPSDADDTHVLGHTNVYRHDLHTGETIRVSGPEGDFYADMPVVSDDGNVVVYRAVVATEQPVPNGPTFGTRDGTELQVFRRDLQTGETRMVSVDARGRPANGNVYPPDVSGDGRVVVFTSDATNLVDGDTNGIADVFVHDVTASMTERVSVNSAGEQQLLDERPENQFYVNQPTVSISRTGRFVAFNSMASNLAPDAREEARASERLCTRPGQDVFVRDRHTGSTFLASVSTSGEAANLCSHDGMLADDGRTVVFTSAADNLVEGDTNHHPSREVPLDGTDLFLHTPGTVR